MKNRHIWLFYISFLGIHFSNLAQNQNDLISNDTIIIKSDSLIKKDYKLILVNEKTFGHRERIRVCSISLFL